MPQFTVEYTVTETTRRRVIVAAESSEEAAELVTEYDADLYDSWQVDSMKYEIADVEVVGTMAEGSDA